MGPVAGSLRAAILTAADGIAKRRSHAAIEPVHLAAAWLEVDPDAAVALGRELTDAVAAALAGQPSAPGPPRTGAAARELVRWLDTVAGWRVPDLAHALAAVLELPGPAGPPATAGPGDPPATPGRGDPPATPGADPASPDRADPPTTLDRGDPEASSLAAPAPASGSSAAGGWRADEIFAGLAKRVVGQDEVLRAISRRVSLTTAGFDLRPERPNGIFLLAGPTGVGKSAIARALAEVLHASADALVTVDLSEYSEPHSVNRLFGPPPGYIGSDDPAGWLSTRISGRPRSVLLLDELEKADPAVWNTFLQVFDSGRLTGSSGRQVQFAEVTIVLTSNLGAAEASRGPVGFGGPVSGAADDLVAAIERTVIGTLPPELVARMDAVLVCRPLSLTAIREILDRELARLDERLGVRGWQLSVTPAAREFIARAGYDPTRGARHLQRNIESLVLEPLVGRTPGAWRLDAGDAGLQWAAGPG